MRFSLSPVLKEKLEIITVGFPFCGFKIIAGLYWTGSQHSTALRALGAVLILLGVIDLFMNTVNFSSLISARKRLVDPCLAETLSRLARQPADFGNSVDVLISFTLVAVWVGGGMIPLLPALTLQIWNWCVVINVLGAGLGRFAASLENRPLRTQ